MALKEQIIKNFDTKINNFTNLDFLSKHGRILGNILYDYRYNRYFLYSSEYTCYILEDVDLKEYDNYKLFNIFVEEFKNIPHIIKIKLSKRFNSNYGMYLTFYISEECNMYCPINKEREYISNILVNKLYKLLDISNIDEATNDCHDCSHEYVNFRFYYCHHSMNFEARIFDYENNVAKWEPDNEIVTETRVLIYYNELKELYAAVRVIEPYILEWLYKPDGPMTKKLSLHFNSLITN